MAMTSRKNKPDRLSKRDELEIFDKQSLIDRILQLEAHNKQLKSVIRKSNEKPDETLKDEEKRRKFDFSRCHQRHILLKFYYLGWNYQGFVVQEGSANTIEHHLFAALTKSCCIKDRESSNYHRCGRTDKGVSAFAQVVSLDIRSRLNPENWHKLEDELPYCKMLNRLLPQDIRCVAWCPVENNFSARFDCKYRMYKYFFPRGNLNVDAMNKAVKYIVGTHDFRNICKMDVGNGVITFNRTVMDAKVFVYKREHEKSKDATGYDMCQLVITSQAFLWHQIRCLMGILLLVGREEEEPEIMLELLNIDRHPRKPQYNMAHEVPLNLYHCEYGDRKWFIDREDLITTVKMLQRHWTINAVKTAMIKSMLSDLESLTHCADATFQSDCLLLGVQSRIYRPLMKRATCDSLEDKIKYFEKRRKIENKRFNNHDDSECTSASQSTNDKQES